MTPCKCAYLLLRIYNDQIVPLFCVVSGCGRIGQISRTMANLETGQDPPYKTSEHCEDTSQRRRETSQHRRETSQLVGLKCRSIATRDARSKRPSKCRSFGGVVSRGYVRTYCCPTRGIVLGLSAVGMVGIKGVVGGSVGRRGEWGDQLYGVMGWK